MTTIRLYSDLHHEFHKDLGTKWISRLDPTGIDILVLAGDIVPLTSEFRFTQMRKKFLAQGFGDIIYVAGNHEYYFADCRVVDAILANNQDDHFTVLRPGIIKEIGGHRFLGGTQWFPYRSDNFQHEDGMNDFSEIKGFRPDYPYCQYEAFRQFYSDAGKPGDIVVTHHLPSELLTPERFRGDQLNRFFSGAVEDLVEANKPKLWLHGHSHDSIDVVDRGCRFIRNPYGYRDYGVNDKFDVNHVVEVS